MLRKLLVLTPYLLAAPVAAAPAPVQGDGCQPAVTKTVQVTATVTALAGPASVAAAAAAEKEADQPSMLRSEQYDPQQTKAGVLAAPQASAAAIVPASPAQASNVPAVPAAGPSIPANNSTPSPSYGHGGYQNSLYFTNWYVA